MKIKIPGSGCKGCELMEIRTRKAVEELQSSATLEKVGDINEIP